MGLYSHADMWAAPGRRHNRSAGEGTSLTDCDYLRGESVLLDWLPRVPRQLTCTVRIVGVRREPEAGANEPRSSGWGEQTGELASRRASPWKAGCGRRPRRPG